ncbi:MAG: RIP metalloprotease RseP [Phycisphaerales bacterium]|nr:RIP metalloprotease RseP [Phycisphaerales bacterium]
MLQCLTNDPGFLLAAVPSWLQSTWNVLQVIIGFSIIVFVHELGHFLAAKWAGVRVERFAVGFGKELIGFTKGETRYSFNLLPLGGYVKMLGQEDFVVDKTGELKVKEDPHSFTNKSVGKRMVIVTAGVVMNLILAAIIFTVVCMVGRRQVPPVLGAVVETAPAGKAGLQPGDRILEINGTKVDDFMHLRALITLSGQDEELVLKVERDGKIVTPYPRIVPEYVEDAEVRQIGVTNGWNFRLASAEAPGYVKLRPDELRKNDELYKLANGSGESQVLKNPADLIRAMIDSNGKPIDVIVKRPKDPDGLTEDQLLELNPDIETTEVATQIHPVWFPLPYESTNLATGSLLGLVPRLTAVACVPDKSFDKAGVVSKDVITRIGTYEFPTHAELKSVIENSADQEVEIEVRRTRMANHGLAGETVEFCARHREDMIQAGHHDLAKAPEAVKKLAGKNGVPDEELDILLKQLGKLGDFPAWCKWFERVDVHKLKPLKPTKPFKLFGDDPPMIDAVLRCNDEDHLLVAEVIKKFGDRETPAHAAGIQRGAVILAVDDQPVRKWYELCNAFQARSGKTAKITYRLVNDIQTTEMQIPDCVQIALDLKRGDRILKIDGQSTVEVPVGEKENGKTKKLALPDWRAVEKICEASIGKTVQIDYVTLDGEKKSGPFTVTANNTDPWLDRVSYTLSFESYSLSERNPIRNPFTALVTGVHQAYRATVQTVQTIRHMIFRNVGVSNVSGPVGIMALGAKVAERGVLELLWIMGLLSANLAVINFLPLPIVDGGLFLFLLLEKIRGEPVSIKTQVATQLIGIALIATVFLLVTYQDIVKLFS